MMKKSEIMESEIEKLKKAIERFEKTIEKAGGKPMIFSTFAVKYTDENGEEQLYTGAGIIGDVISLSTFLVMLKEEGGDAIREVLSIVSSFDKELAKSVLN